VISIVKTKSSKDVKKAIELLGGMENFVKKGEHVLVKPNICIGKRSETGAVTDAEMVAEVCEMVHSCGADVVVGESPIYPWNGKKVFEEAGYGDFEEKYGFKMINLDDDEKVTIKIPNGVAIKQNVVAKTVLKSDKIINMPVLKTHLQTTLTLSLKNIKGIVPGRYKHYIHVKGLDDGIVDLNTVIRSDLQIVDGIIGMHGKRGPTGGKAVEIGVIVAGDNRVEVDSICARIVGIDPMKVAHIRKAYERGLGDIDVKDVRGSSIDDVRVNIEVPLSPTLMRFLISNILLRTIHTIADPVLSLLGRNKLKIGAIVKEIKIDNRKCRRCMACVKGCPVNALAFEGGELKWDRERCIFCYCCVEICKYGAIDVQ